MVVRAYNEELAYLEKKSPYKWEIKKGFQPNMRVNIWILLKKFLVLIRECPFL